MNKFIHQVIKNRLFVVLVCLFIVIMGLFSYYVIPKQENPNTAAAVATIVTVYPGASPEEVEKNVSEVIEAELSTLPDIDYYTSQSMNSASVVAVVFDLELTIDQVEDDLRKVVEDIQPKLPDLAEESIINTDLVNENQFIISLSSDLYSQTELADYAEIVKDTIGQVAGIEQILIEGLPEKQVEIITDPAKMQSYGVSIENILQLMQAQNLSIPSGSIEYESGEINVVAPAIFESVADIENLVINGSSESLSFVKLKDVAEIEITETSDYYFSQDGKPAILITGTIEDGQNAVNVGADLRVAIENSKNLVPGEVIFHEVLYAPADIEDSINGFIMNLFQSIALIMIVVMLGVNLRNGIIVSIALPISILFTFIVMNLLEMQFHFITISGLIVSLGILVDNAIVISEAIQHHLNHGIEKTQSIINAVKETAVPVLTSTLTTIVTFSIIYFVPGVTGQVAGDIPTVVITALIASYFVAMLVIPVFAYWFFRPETKAKKAKKTYMARAFMAMLKLALKHKITTVVSAFLTLGVAAFLALQLGMQFFPVASKPVNYISFEGEDISLAASTDVSLQINEVLDNEAVIDNYTYAVGGDLPSFFLTVPSIASAPNVGQYMLQLNEEELEKLGGPEATSKYLQSILDNQIVGANVTVKSLEYSIPTDAKISFVIYGDDVEKLTQTADLMVSALGEIEGTSRIQSSSINSQYEYNVNLDSEVLSSYGLLKYDVVKQINTSLMGAVAGVYQTDDSNLDIVLRSDINSLEDLQNLQIVGSVADTKVLLSQISTIDLQPSVPIIQHYNGKYYLQVLSNVLPGYNSFAIETEFTEDYLPNIDLQGITIESKGEVSNMLDLVVSLVFSAGFAVMIIYIILLFQFKTLKKPLIVLASIPLSFIGCGFGLWIFKMDIQAMALLGLVSLFGIVVNNSILLIEVMDTRLKAGESAEEACLKAVKLRFRPIMLSTTTTCIGLVPLILSADPMSAPMASVLLFGLLFSTVLTMVVVPTIYAIVENKKAYNGHNTL